jgi:hypothetical protein
LFVVQVTIAEEVVMEFAVMLAEFRTSPETSAEGIPSTLLPSTPATTK